MKVTVKKSKVTKESFGEGNRPYISLHDPFNNPNKVDLNKQAKWIKEFWIKMRVFPDKVVDDLMDWIEAQFGKHVLVIIDSVFTADKLHYFQNGRSKPDTFDFIMNFNKISNQIDKKINSIYRKENHMSTAKKLNNSINKALNELEVKSYIGVLDFPVQIPQMKIRVKAIAKDNATKFLVKVVPEDAYKLTRAIIEGIEERLGRVTDKNAFARLGKTPWEFDVEIV